MNHYMTREEYSSLLTLYNKIWAEYYRVLQKYQYDKPNLSLVHEIYPDDLQDFILKGFKYSNRTDENNWKVIYFPCYFRVYSLRNNQEVMLNKIVIRPTKIGANTIEFKGEKYQNESFCLNDFDDESYVIILEHLFTYFRKHLPMEFCSMEICS